MGIEQIPVMSVGPGSQPAETDGAQLDYIDMPKEMARFTAPEIPEPEAVSHLQGAREAMAWLQDALVGFRSGDPNAIADLSLLGREDRDLVNQILGEGEVSAQFDGAPRARMQESVLAGVWRTMYLDGEDRIVRDLLEVGEVPILVRSARGEGTGTDVPLGAGVVNAPAVLTEVFEHQTAYRPGGDTHTVNLSLLPMSDEDSTHIDSVLGQGAVRILSRGYGDCRIESTHSPRVWRVRYFNSTNKLILDTIEVTDVPKVACAAQEDIDDSARRLAEMIGSYWNDLNRG